MARTFAGSTATDNISATISAVNTAWSQGVWCKPTGLEDLKKMVYVGTTGAGAQIFLNSTGGSFFVSEDWTGGVARQVSTNCITTGAWNCVIGTTDGTNTGTNYHCYWGTQSQVMINVDNGVTSSSGTQQGFTGACIGNRQTDLTRAFPGAIAQAFMVPWQMTLDECERFRLGDWTVLFAHGQPKFFLPLAGASLWDIGGATSNWTNTGATVSEDPPRGAWAKIEVMPITPVSAGAVTNVVTFRQTTTMKYDQW